MCYLKNLIPQDSIDFDEYFQKGDETCVEQPEEDRNVLIPCAHRHLKPHWSEEQQLLVSLFQKIENNNTLIKALYKSLDKPSVIAFEKQHETPQLPIEILEDLGSSKVDEESSATPSVDKDLCIRLFGNHKYKYYLKLAEDFPKVIYKERNFNLTLQLVDGNNKVTRNCNILNLCCAVSTSNAEWIHENRAGEPFLKGKTEVELYKGEATFAKVYARDVSRIHPEGKVNLVIYTKPSTLLYAGSNSLELPVNSEDVRPLIIPDLIIKAKKKE